MEKRAEDYKKFLSERKLGRAYNKWLKTRYIRKRIINVSIPDFDGHVKQTKLYIYRSKNRTIFSDFYTLEILGKSRRKVNDAIKHLFIVKREKFTEHRSYTTLKNKNLSWNVTFDIPKKDIKLNFKHVLLSYNNTLKRLRKVTNTNVIRNKMNGRIVVDAVFISGDGHKHRTLTKSGYGFLRHLSVRNELINQALAAGTSKCGFSPVEIIIMGIWYEYWEDKDANLRSISR